MVETSGSTGPPQPPPPPTLGRDDGTTTSTVTMLSLKRQLYTGNALDAAYPRQDEAPSAWKSLRENFTCTRQRWLRVFLGRFPIIGFLRRYKWRSDLVSDIMAGVCVAFLMIPLGLALGLLATLPPVYGMYTTLFPCILYMLFGTSPHTSFGVHAVIAVLIASVIQDQKNKLLASDHQTQTPASNSTGETSSVFSGSDDELAFKVGVATSVSLLSGVILTGAGLFKLGFVTAYFSKAFLGGFTTATAVHIVTSQISKLINIRVHVYSGVGKLVKTYVDIFENIGDANPADIVISVISLAFLLIVTILVNERFKPRMKVPVPTQLILVVISTLITHFSRLESRYGIAVIGSVPTGLPAPSVPDPSKYPGIAYDSLVTAILIFTFSISLAKLAAQKHDYDVNANQEFLAYGLCNTISSFFSCFPSCNAPPRVMILSDVGAKTTVHAVVSAILVLVVLLAAGPLFSSLPVAVLAAMICATMKTLLLQATRLPYLWRTSKPDLIVWVVTFLVSVFADLDVGIIAGVLLSFFTVIAKNQLASGSRGAVCLTEDLVHLNGNRKGVKLGQDFAIFYFPSPLYFANADNFKKQIFDKVYNPHHDHERTSGKENIIDNDDSKNRKNSYNFKHDRDNNGISQPGTPAAPLKFVVIQCSAFTYTDLDGALVMKEVADLYRKAGVEVLLSNCPHSFTRVMEKVGYFDAISRDSLHFDVHDAVSFISQSRQLNKY